MAPDVNVLVAAFHADHPHYAKARAWLQGAVKECAGGGRLHILPMVAAGFLRVVTNKRAFDKPASTDEALRFLQALLASPGVEMPAVGAEWPVLRALCARLKLAGNDIPDAWIAAAVQSLDGHLVSFDRGFGKLLPKSDFTLLAP